MLGAQPRAGHEPGELRQLLTAAAVYAAGGLKALRKSAGAKLLIEQLR